jgi:hypothetical protein
VGEEPKRESRSLSGRGTGGGATHSTTLTFEVER